MKKAAAISLNCHKKNGTVACGSSPIKIHYFVYPKCFINRINEVYDFSIKYRYSDVLLNKNPIKFIYNRLFFCNHTLVIVLAWFL